MNVGPVIVRRGACATEAALRAEVEALAAPLRGAAASGTPASALAALLAAPVRIVVPSRSLREHVAARLAQSLGGAGAGVVVQSLLGLAFEVVRNAGERVRGGHRLFPIVVRQVAREEPALRAALDDLEDGYGAVAASVSDLLDAGFEPALTDGLLDCLAEAPPGARADRARALVRVAERTVARLEEYGLEHRAGLFQRAREALEQRPGLLPARAIRIHGYADATGVQLELLRALCTLSGARVLVDHPGDPTEPARADPARVFTDRLVVRLGGVADDSGPSAAPPSVALFRAAGAQAEAREVAERVRGLLDSGVAPEAVGIAARDLGPYRLALQVQLLRLGIPFSGGEGSLAREGRRIRALLDLLRDGEDTPGDRWLDAADLFASEPLRDLRLALHGIGLGRVRDVAATDARRVAGEKGYPLPVRRGLISLPSADPGPEEVEVDADAASTPAAPVRRWLERATLARATERAARLRAELEALARGASLGELVDGVRGLLVRALAWKPSTAGFVETQSALTALEEELGRDVRLSFGELRLLLEGALADAGRAPLGGGGAGVQLLSVGEARGRTFERLFVLGMNRELFPRAIAEDPLLPDALRVALEAVLPDIPIKRRGFVEERYLFAQLCSAAPAVTLSWQAVSDDGKERLASPLVEPLLASRAESELPLAPVLWERESLGLRPAHEHAVQAALSGDPERLEALLAIAESAGMPSAEATAHARARVAAIRELDSTGRSGRDLGPYFGFVGALGDAGDPRRADHWVTRLEGLSRCGWQTFLERVLRVQPVPDALDALPKIDRRLIGQVVHAALESIAVAAGVPAGVEIAAALAAGPRDVPWPAPETLEPLVLAAAERIAREEGIALSGFARLLARRAGAFLERVRELDWPGGRLQGVLGVEIQAAIAVSAPDGRALPLSFRADRVDLGDAGLRLTDYKVGAPFSTARDPAQRREALRTRIDAGLQLQAAAYARLDSGRSTGRYLYALPTLEAERAECAIEPGDTDSQERFEHAVGVLASAWREGSLVPKLLAPNLSETGASCAVCTVRAACLQGDSGARRRLARWIEERAAAPDPPASAPERALLLAWQLGAGAAQ